MGIAQPLANKPGAIRQRRWLRLRLVSRPSCSSSFDRSPRRLRYKGLEIGPTTESREILVLAGQLAAVAERQRLPQRGQAVVEMAGEAVNDRRLVDHVRDLRAQGQGLAGMTSRAL